MVGFFLSQGNDGEDVISTSRYGAAAELQLLEKVILIDAGHATA
ncbi:homeobox-DDT domain protein RLT2 isoform X1 [Iris pallida]|uniref:Homeobox-DDT domain protein RLT2 isoform X1 n=1 Tax=Iris pallida TaxID=29817 RepID=A0AAX6EG69_IRIPA|nr:homeobox-DDT domain protein RLT2 isoform X1 [Iris pallida]